MRSGCFTTSYRDVEELLAERGLNISYEPPGVGCGNSDRPKSSQETVLGFAEIVQALIEPHIAGGRVMMLDQRPRVPAATRCRDHRAPARQRPQPWRLRARTSSHAGCCAAGPSACSATAFRRYDAASQSRSPPRQPWRPRADAAWR